MTEMNQRDLPKTKSEALERIREAIQGYVRAADIEQGDGDGNLILIDFIFSAVSIDPATSDSGATYTNDGTGHVHTHIGLGELFLQWAKDIVEYEDDDE